MSNEIGQGAIGGIAAGAKSGGTLTGGPWGAVVGGILGGLGGAMSGSAVSSAKKRKQKVFDEYMAQLAMIDAPKYEDLKLTLERYQNGEQLTPEQLGALQEVDSEVSKITEDKMAKQGQLEAIAALKARSRGGLTLQDKADLMEASREIDRQTSGAQKAITQNLQARGQTGSGQELAMRLGAQQQGAQLASSNALNIAAQSRAQAIQALKDSAAMGRQIGQDNLDLQKTKANAVDDTRKRNLERLQTSMQYNVGNKNRAAELNNNRANAVADKNVGLSNEEQERNKQLLLDEYEREKERLGFAYKERLGDASNRLNDAKNQTAGVIGTIGSIGDAIGSLGKK